MSDIDDIIEHGIVFKAGGAKAPKQDDNKVKTKAKKNI